MSFRINPTDSIGTQRLKLLYMIPISLVISPFYIIWFGVSVIPEFFGEVFGDTWNIVKGRGI